MKIISTITAIILLTLGTCCKAQTNQDETLLKTTTQTPRVDSSMQTNLLDEQT